MLSLLNNITALSPLFLLENKTKNPEKTTGTIFKFQYLKKGLHFREQFYNSSEQVSDSSKL